MEINVETGKNNPDQLTRDADSRTSKWYRRIDNHPFLSAVSIILSGYIIFQIIPFAFFSFLPPVAFKYLKFGFYAGIPAWIFSRQIANRLYTVPLDVIYVADPGEDEITKTFKYRKGKFKNEFEFEGGKPQTWSNSHGLKCYQVMEIDFQEKVARSSWISDLSAWEVMKFRENWEAQKIWNDKQRKRMAEFQLREDQIISKIKSEISNAWIRDLEKLDKNETIREARNNAVPDDILPDQEIDFDDLMEDLDGPEDLSREIKEKQENQGKTDE